MFSRVDLSTGALAGGSRYAFAGGNPISNLAFNGHDCLPTLAGIGGALAVAGVCLAIGVATAEVGMAVGTGTSDAVAVGSGSPTDEGAGGTDGQWEDERGWHWNHATASPTNREWGGERVWRADPLK